MPIEQKQQTTSANSPSNIIILVGKNNNRKQLETRIEQAKEAIRKATGQGMEVKFDKIHILGDGIKTIQEVVKENEALLQSTEFTEDNTALFLLAHGGYNEKGFGGFIDNRQSLQEFLKAYPHLTKFPIKTGFCYDGSMFKTATQKELKELGDLKFLEGVSVENLEQKEGEELLQEYKTQTKKLTDKIETNRGNSIIKDATISTSTSSKFEELESGIIENIGQYFENIYSNPKSPLEQLIAEDLASPSSRYILHNNKITKLSRFLKGLNVESDEVKDNDLKGLAEKFIINRKAELIESYPDQKDFIETLGATKKELNLLTDKILNKALILFAHRGTPSAAEILLSKEKEIDINRPNQDRFTALHIACAKGHQEIVETLLASEKINPNLKTNDGRTTLHLACYKGHQEIVKMLLEKGANPNLKTNDGVTALYLACENGNQKIVKMLLANETIEPNLKTNDGATALHLACQNGDQEIVKMLLANEKIDLNISMNNGDTALQIACENGDEKIVKMLLANEKIDPNIPNQGFTALHLACEDGDQEIVKMLLANEKIDPNIPDQDGQTALHIAYQNNHQEIVKMLLANEKIDPNIPDQYGWTALHIACKEGYQEIVETLLEKGADINSKNHQGETALYLACRNGRIEVVKTLLKNEKINPNIPDKNVNTALHFACYNGHQEIVKTLLANKNIDPNISDQNGNTALHIACAKGHQEVVKILLEKGADINLKNHQGETALDVAGKNNRQEIMDYLVKNGALTGTDLSKKRSSKSSEAKDGLDPSSSPAPTGDKVKLASKVETKGHQQISN